MQDRESGREEREKKTEAGEEGKNSDHSKFPFSEKEWEIVHQQK